MFSYTGNSHYLRFQGTNKMTELSIVWDNEIVKDSADDF